MSDYDLNEDALSGGEFSGSQNETNASQPIESAFPDEDEETITMLDVIEREDKLEEEASAVLGNSDEKNCTYPKGYVSRQALYSCATCFDSTKTQAAICLACSLECHENHDVYELYTKRNYRCDCGNSKFNTDFKCKLEPKKVALNDNNLYNHNFSGKYCICDKRYPPDENDDSPLADDEMLQCIICEDWYHERHLGIKEIPNRFDELICEQCVDKLDFLQYYKMLDDPEDVSPSASPKRGSLCCVKSAQKIRPNNLGSESESEVHHFNHIASQPSCSQSSSSSSSSTNNQQIESKAAELPSVVSKSESCTNVIGDARDVVSETDTSDSQVENKDPSETGSQLVKPTGPTANVTPESVSDSCKLHKIKLECEEKPIGKGSIFWNSCKWRANLCKCQKCMSMYESKGCLFLIDEKDTVQYYEAQGKALAKNKGTPLERGMSALNRMNRAAVVEALHGYDELKADLSSYLKKFAESKKVVREEDIHEFFNQLRSKKRPRLDES